MNIPIELTPLWEHLASPGAYRLSLALLHFLWQGIAIALLAALAMRLIGRRSPHRRYAIGLVGLLAMAIAPIITFFLISPPMPALEFVASAAVPTDGPTDTAALGSDELTVEINRLDALIAHLESQLNKPATSPNPLPPVTSKNESWLELLQQSQPYLLLAWLIGATICSLRLAIGAQASWRYRWGKKALPEQTRDVLVRVAKRLGVKTPRVFVTDRVLEALALGLVRPMILLPAAWIGKIPPELLEAVLAHEIAHLRRHDLWINLAQRCLETLLFYHPALWWLSRRVRIEREYCCDEIAAHTLDCRAAYARALEFVAAERLLAGRLATLNTALVANMGGEEMALLNRVRRVLGTELTPTRTPWRWATGPVLLLPVCLWGAFLWADGLALADGEEKKPVVAEQKADEPETPSLTTDDLGTSPETDPAPFATETEQSEPQANPFVLTKQDDNDQELQRLKAELAAAESANKRLQTLNKVLQNRTHELFEQFAAIKKNQRNKQAKTATTKNAPPFTKPSTSAKLLDMLYGVVRHLDHKKGIDQRVVDIVNRLREEVEKGSPFNEVPQPATRAYLQEIGKALALKQAKLLTLKVTKGPDHPEVQSLEQRLSTLQNMLNDWTRLESDSQRPVTASETATVDSLATAFASTTLEDYAPFDSPIKITVTRNEDGTFATFHLRNEKTGAHLNFKARYEQAQQLVVKIHELDPSATYTVQYHLKVGSDIQQLALPEPTSREKSKTNPEEGPNSQDKILEPAPQPSGAKGNLKSLRQQYKDALLRQLEALKAQKASHRKFAQKLIEKGDVSEDQLATIDLKYDPQIVEILGKLLELKKQAATRDSASNDKPSLSDNLSTEQDHTVEVPFGQFVEMTTSHTPIAKATTTENVFSSRSLQNGKYHLELNAKEKTATVTFYEPTLGLTIHVETPLEKLPELLQRLAKRRSKEPAVAEPFAPPPSASPFGTAPAYEPPGEPAPDGFTPPSTYQGFQPPTEESPYMGRAESETSNVS